MRYALVLALGAFVLARVWHDLGTPLGATIAALAILLSVIEATHPAALLNVKASRDWIMPAIASHGLYALYGLFAATVILASRAYPEAWCNAWNLLAVCSLVCSTWLIVFRIRTGANPGFRMRMLTVGLGIAMAVKATLWLPIEVYSGLDMDFGGWWGRVAFLAVLTILSVVRETLGDR